MLLRVYYVWKCHLWFIPHTVKNGLHLDFLGIYFSFMSCLTASGNRKYLDSPFPEIWLVCAGINCTVTLSLLLFSVNIVLEIQKSSSFQEPLCFLVCWVFLGWRFPFTFLSQQQLYKCITLSESDIGSNYLLIASGTMFRSTVQATPPIKTTPSHAPNCVFYYTEFTETLINIERTVQL